MLMLTVIGELLLDAFLDTLKLVPFLFLTYLGMEYIEHHTGAKTQQIVSRAGRFGPAIGGTLGIVPQCGFSAAAANLYAGRVITVGTLLAVFLSTSDEMLPIFLSHSVEGMVIVKILLLKALLAVCIGMGIDAVMRIKRKGNDGLKIVDFCQHEHCHCEQSIVKSAIHHTVKIALYIFIISTVLNVLLKFIGEAALGQMLAGQKILAVFMSAVIGLIPNCASSVVITELYLEGVLGTGAMLAGLLVGSGTGLLVLLRVNKDRIQNAKIIGALYFAGVACGVVFECIGISLQ